MSKLRERQPELRPTIDAVGGRCEALIPDFVIGASASYYSGRLLTTNPRDFFRAFPTLEVLMPSVFVERYRAPDNDPENGQM